MTYVVTEPCFDCKYTDCAAVCPVEAFHELPDRLYINADTCIDYDMRSRVSSRSNLRGQQRARRPGAMDTGQHRRSAELSE